MIVLDTSALVAILRREQDADRLLDALAAVPSCHVSAGTLLEAMVVMRARHGDEGVRDLRLLLQAANARVEPFDEEQAEVGMAAFERFGKGRHPAALNLGDLFAYALATHEGLPLLYVGEDFAQTDVRPA
ncbi:MAG: type II toxin-antitoxin system VapC family toxin [Trueperaceae bacterium]|nr:type II toxin-antitoxin system VapC family toxin [Trueperaceae bacterium]